MDAMKTRNPIARVVRKIRPKVVEDKHKELVEKLRLKESWREEDDTEDN